jgi:hypothetical protein
MSLQNKFIQIEVNQSDATEVLNLLSEQEALHTAESVSVFNRRGWSREAGIVLFNSINSLVKRKDYVQVRSQNAVLLTKEKLLVFIQTIVSEEILEEPYESDMRKNLAILRYIHESLIADAEPFSENQPTVSLMGLARSALSEATVKLSQNPLQVHELLENNGYKFDHTVLGKTCIKLKQDTEDIFTLRVTAEDWVDGFNTW